MELTAAPGPDGSTVLAWLRADGTSSACCEAIEATRRPAGGAFEAPVKASEPEQQSGELHVPWLASKGNATVLAWARGALSRDECCRSLVARDWPTGAPLGPSTSSDLDYPGYVSELALGSDSTAHALVEELVPGSIPSFPVQAVSRPPGGAFGSVETLSRDGTASGLALEADGSAHAVWTESTTTRCDRYDCLPAGSVIIASDARPGAPFVGRRRLTVRHGSGGAATIAAWGGGALVGWDGGRGPWVDAFGGAAGPAPVTKPHPGPQLSRFVRRGRLTFAFTVSKPATVLLQIAGAVVGNVTETVGRGRHTVRISAALAARMAPGSYAASLVASDASGHDSAAIRPVYFTFAAR